MEVINKSELRMRNYGRKVFVDSLHYNETSRFFYIFTGKLKHSTEFDKSILVNNVQFCSIHVTH